jgi:ApaG protein
MNEKYQIDVTVKPLYLPHQSEPGEGKYVFSYTVTLSNTGQLTASLLTRHWIITNGNGDREEVRGGGVVGEHPRLRPGESYQYTSASVLVTPVGTMGGSYQMRAEDGTRFDAKIPTFTLSAIALH